MSGSRGVRLTSEELEGVAGGLSVQPDLSHVVIQSGANPVLNDYTMNIAPQMQTLDPHTTVSGTLQVANIAVPDTHAPAAATVAVTAHDVVSSYASSSVSTSHLPAVLADAVFAERSGTFTKITPHLGPVDTNIVDPSAGSRGLTSTNIAPLPAATSY